MLPHKPNKIMRVRNNLNDQLYPFGKLSWLCLLFQRRYRERQPLPYLAGSALAVRERLACGNAKGERRTCMYRNLFVEAVIFRLPTSLSFSLMIFKKNPHHLISGGRGKIIHN